MPLPFTLAHDPRGRLVLTLPDGTSHVGVDPARAFPITDPGGPVSLLDADGHEVAAVPRLADLPTELRQTLEDALAERHFLPIIRRIVRIIGQVEPVECEVETDRGPVKFTIKAEEDVRRLPGGPVLIADAHGVRYLIPDVSAMDAGSRRWLARYILI